MDTTTYNTLAPDVKTAAKTAARTWPGIIDEDDAEQEIWLRLLDAGQNTIDKLAQMDRPLRVSSLNEIGHQIGSKYRDDYEHFSGNSVYGTEMVRELLRGDALDFLTLDDGQDAWTLDKKAIKKLSFLQRPDSMTVTTLIDMSIGIKSLFESNSGYAAEIVNRYRFDIRPGNGSARMKLTRAVDALTREMNASIRQRKAEYTEGPGTRKVLTNAEAQKITRNDYSR